MEHPFWLTVFCFGLARCLCGALLRPMKLVQEVPRRALTEKLGRALSSGPKMCSKI
jgi:hypothetical protein